MTFKLPAEPLIASVTKTAEAVKAPVTEAMKAPVTEAVETPETPEMPAVEATLTLAQPLPTARPRAFYIASQWNIEAPMGSDMINAINNQTGDRYEGPISDFNEMLKGN